MTPYDPATGKIGSGSISQQTQLVLENVKAFSPREVHRLAMSSAASLLVESDARKFQGDERSVFALLWESKPARATIGAQLLGFDVEIECVAVLD